MTAAPVLEARGLTRHFGGVAALDGLDLRIEQGEIRCVIGPNGAGKTTFLNVVSGLVRPSTGVVAFEGRDVTGKSAKAIADLGLVRTFQTPTVFPGLTVRGNLELGARRPGAPREGADERVEQMLEEIALRESAEALAADLSHGEKKRLELGMVLAGAPRVLMLDEPTAGMSIRETDEIVAMVRRLRGDMTVIIVEHDMSFVRQIADRVSVFHRGALLTEGSLAEVKADERVRDVYLGSAID
jgi:branched-chain amino acid transport system ATP-binding protein